MRNSVLKKSAFSLPALVIIVLFMVNFHAELLQGYARCFTVDTASRGADAVVILGGSPQTRPDHAARLIKEGYADAIFLTSPKPLGKRFTRLFGDDNAKSLALLAEYDLNATVIPSLKGGATSTFDEAYDLLAFVEGRPIRHIILVTDAYHSSRALYAFEKVKSVMGRDDLYIEISPAPNDLFSEEDWWQAEAGLKAYLLEPVKYIFYLFNTTNAPSISEH